MLIRSVTLSGTRLVKQISCKKPCLSLLKCSVTFFFCLFLYSPCWHINSYQKPKGSQGFHFHSAGCRQGFIIRSVRGESEGGGGERKMQSPLWEVSATTRTLFLNWPKLAEGARTKENTKCTHGKKNDNKLKLHF